MTVTTTYEGVEFDSYNGMRKNEQNTECLGSSRRVPKVIQDLNINPLERSLNVFCFEKKKSISEDGLNHCGWVCRTDLRWLRFKGNKNEIAYLAMFSTTKCLVEA